MRITVDGIKSINAIIKGLLYLERVSSLSPYTSEEEMIWSIRHFRKLERGYGRVRWDIWNSLENIQWSVVKENFFSNKKVLKR